MAVPGSIQLQQITLLADVSRLRGAHLDGNPGGFVDVTAEEMLRGVRLNELADRAAAGVDVSANLIQPRVGRRSVANKRQW